MRCKHLFLVGLLAVLLPAVVSAQTQTLDGVARMSRSAISPVYAGNEVKGYVLYAKGDKVDSENDSYRLDFFDQDLNKVSSLAMQKPSGKYYFLSNTFNGTAFALYFFNVSTRSIEVETYDTSLKRLGAKLFGGLKIDDLMIMQRALGQQLATGGEPASSVLSMFPVPGHGFVRTSTEGKQKGFGLQLYDDQLNPKWSLTSDPKSKFYESVVLNEVVGNYLLATVTRHDSPSSRKLDSYLMAIDVETGKKILDTPVETSATEQLALSSFTYEPAKHEFVALGEYYKPTDKPFINRSQGFFIKRFSETGQPLATKNYGWQTEVKAALPAEARQSVEDGFVNFTHSIVRGADGNTYIVAEQYKITVDGLGLLNSNSAAAKGRIGNLLVFALDPSYALTGAKFYAKDPSKAFIPVGEGLSGTGALGHYFKQSGQFDYQFIQKNDANSQFNAVYINYDKEKGEQTKKIIGNISFGDNGQFKLDKIDGTSSATSSFLYPAKPGYLMMVDFLKKDKKLGMKLVKLNI